MFPLHAFCCAFCFIASATLWLHQNAALPICRNVTRQKALEARNDFPKKSEAYDNGSVLTVKSSCLGQVEKNKYLYTFYYPISFLLFCCFCNFSGVLLHMACHHAYPFKICSLYISEKICKHSLYNYFISRKNSGYISMIIITKTLPIR